jgi:hypothetical protein
MLTRTSRLLLSLTAAPLLVAACTDNTLTNPLNDADGTYQLTVYDGRSVPTTYTINPGDPNYPEYPNGATFVVTGGTMVLNSNGTFTETNNYVFTPTGEPAENQSFVSNGTWTLDGEDFHFTAPAQNNNGPRNIFGTITENVNGDLVINYQESNGAGVPSAFEYQRN